MIPESKECPSCIDIGNAHRGTSCRFKEGIKVFAEGYMEDERDITLAGLTDFGDDNIAQMSDGTWLSVDRWEQVLHESIAHAVASKDTRIGILEKQLSSQKAEWLGLPDGTKSPINGLAREEVDRLIIESNDARIAQLEASLTYTQEALSTITRALRAVEWDCYHSDVECVNEHCHAFKSEGHKSDCIVGIALRGAE